VVVGRGSSCCLGDRCCLSAPNGTGSTLLDRYMPNLGFVEPRFRIWVPGRPLAVGSGSRSRYRQSIADAARAAVPAPTSSRRVDIEVWFVARKLRRRADVDNVLKVILDALKGIVYEDDAQVRSVRVVALPLDDAHVLPGQVSLEALARLVEQPEHFLINIFDDIAIPGHGP